MSEFKPVLSVLIGLAGVFLRSFKLLMRVVLSLSVGVVLLVVLNAALELFGFYVAINPLTVITVALLQLPGLVLLAFLACFFV